MAKTRIYSKYSTEAVLLLAKQIKLGRKQRQWTTQELAERAGISRATLQKIEHAELTCSVGLVFEVAALVGVPLFNAQNQTLAPQLESLEDKLALLPKTIHKSKKTLDDDF